MNNDIKKMSEVAELFIEREKKSIIQTSKKFYNSWRAIRFTLKGRNAGCSNDWLKFDGFYNDMFPTYTDGFLIARRDKKLPFSKENCFWIEKSLHRLTRSLVKLSYNNENLTLKEWAVKLGISLPGLQQRYHLGNGYTTEEILFGKKRNKRKILPEDDIRIRGSKLVATYKVKDKNRGGENDIDKVWFIEHILLKPCNYCGGHDRIGADRIDNSKGHLKTNVVPCCHSCNTMRGDRFSPEEMKMIGDVIRKIHLQRNEKKS